MGFKKSFKKIGKQIYQATPTSFADKLITGGKVGDTLFGEKSGGGAVDYGFQDPNKIAAEERGLLDKTFGEEEARLKGYQRGGRGLADILSDASYRFDEGQVGPGIEEDEAAYQAALDAAEARRGLDEARGTERVLGGLQGRGIARSGIALKDVVEQVLGPSLLRGQELASQFGLEKARRKSDILEGQRGYSRQANLQRLSGRQGAIGSYDEGDRSFDQNKFNALTNLGNNRLRGLADIGQTRLSGVVGERNMNLQQSIEDRRAMEERRRRRKSGLTGLIGGGVGGYIGGPAGAGAGQQIGQGLGEMF